jgi:hypothetical protein
MPDRLARTLRRLSLNQLLVVHLGLCVPLIVCALVFHGAYAIGAYLQISVGWGVASQLRRLAWKKQFRPRQKARA